MLKMLLYGITMRRLLLFRIITWTILVSGIVGIEDCYYSNYKIGECYYLN